MKKNKKIISALILLSLATLGVFLSIYQVLQKENNYRVILSANSLNSLGKASRVSEYATFKANNQTYSLNISDEISVYDFMTKLKNENKINFTEQSYAGMGELITSINGIKNNNNQNWIYYVNGAEAQVGVSNYKIKNGDVVSFVYEKSNY